MFGRIFSLSKSCRICGLKPAEPIYDSSVPNALASYYCREHLVEALREDFTAYEGNIVLTDPNPGKNFNKQYPFYPAETLDSFEFSEEDVQSITLFLRSINSNHCQACQGQAGVLYFPRESLPAEVAVDDDFYGQATSAGLAGVYYCKRHAYDLLAPKLLSHNSQFIRGIVKPYGNEGIYLAAYQ